MKQLDKKFIGKGEVKGFKFKQLKTNGYAFFYEVDTENGKHWEVFEHRKVNDIYAIIGGIDVHFEAKVIYPTSNAFGIWAFCCNSYDKAEYYFNKLSEAVKQRIECKKQIF